MPGDSINIQAGAAGTGAAISWKLAIQIAAVVGTIVGVLSAVLAAGSVLWVAVGAVVAMGIYHRRRPLTKLGPRVGARVGALLGLIAATVAFRSQFRLTGHPALWAASGQSDRHSVDRHLKQAAARAATMDSRHP